MKLTLKEIEKCVKREDRTLYLGYFGYSILLQPRILTDTEIQLVCRYLKDNPEIAILEIWGNKFGKEGVMALAAITTLTELNMGGNSIDNVCINSFATNTTLRKLIARNCNIGNIGTKVLAANTSIRTLDLSGNRIGNDGAKALAANVTIKALNVSRNKISQEGAKALAANTTLISLDISWCYFGDPGAQALAANSSLTLLKLTGNCIGDQGANAIAKNTTIKTLEVDNNCIGAKGAKVLLANFAINTLSIRYNNIQYEEAWRVIVHALKNNFSLVNFWHTIPDESTRETINKVLTRNKLLPWLVTIKHARLMAQAQRSYNCPLGELPVELFSHINDYAVGANHFSFFVSQFEKRPTAQDLIAAKQMLLP